MPDIKTLC